MKRPDIVTVQAVQRRFRRLAVLFHVSPAVLRAAMTDDCVALQPDKNEHATRLFSIVRKAHDTLSVPTHLVRLKHELHPDPLLEPRVSVRAFSTAAALHATDAVFPGRARKEGTRRRPKVGTMRGSWGTFPPRCPHKHKRRCLTLMPWTLRMPCTSWPNQDIAVTPAESALDCVASVKSSPHHRLRVASSVVFASLQASRKHSHSDDPILACQPS